MTKLKNVCLKNLTVGGTYVFGSYYENLGFVPIKCSAAGSRVTVKKVGRKYVYVEGTKDPFYGEGFFKVEDARQGYREALKKRQQNGYPQTDEEIDHLVNNL